MMRFFLLILAVLVLLSMVGYAGYLWVKLQRQKQQIAEARKARVTRIIESIETIARAMLSEQCNLSEGVLRLKPLLDVLGTKKLQAYPAMWELYLVVETMPIGEARKTLVRNQRMRLDLEREAAEAEKETRIQLELQQLLADISLCNKDF